MATAPSSLYGSYRPLPTFDPNDPNGKISQRFTQTADQINQQGNQINDAALAQQAYYGPRQQQQTDLIDPALAQLNQTPGYNAEEAARIGQDYGVYRTPNAALEGQALTPEEQSNMLRGFSDAQAQTEKGNAAQGAMLNQYQGNLGGQVENYGNYVRSGLDTLGTGLDSATSKLDTGLQGAQSKFGKLDSAVNDQGLAFDPNGTMKQLTDTDVQNIKTDTGRRVGNMYRNEEDDITRRAAAAGNSSPLAIAAAKARLANQSAADMGDAEASANIAAKQAQYDRAAGIEGQRLGATQTQAGMRANAATQEQAAAQAAALASGQAGIDAAGLYGTQSVQAGKDVGAQGINAANQYGQYSTATAGEMGDRSTAAATNSANNANSLILNNQATRKDINDTRYGQGMDTAAANSQGQQTIGNQRIAGNAAYREGVTGQQGMAQQGGQKAVDQQNDAYGTKASGLTANTANRANYENTGPGALGKMGGQLLNAVAGTASSAAAGGAKFGFAEGGSVGENTLAKVGEAGPEAVYGRYGMTTVNGPETVLLEPGDTVVPLNKNPKNKVSMPRYCAA